MCSCLWGTCCILKKENLFHIVYLYIHPPFYLSVSFSVHLSLITWVATGPPKCTQVVLRELGEVRDCYVMEEQLCYSQRFQSTGYWSLGLRAIIIIEVNIKKEILGFLNFHILVLVQPFSCVILHKLSSFIKWELLQFLFPAHEWPW